ncbi:unnamed protein product [Ostreobium quekettii]|uniref:Uncharacterized protein n=1 Tax=Ostreobium quekettii TaxID=121088 RepID=A0A8S1JF97_9CHLO|nr:unnamed protein product [Ostreobium quekettii]|eukprot:evm.model.scf_366.7 EVM.evm.TU.scf_366.7   scf_366:80014-93425(-)
MPEGRRWRLTGRGPPPDFREEDPNRGLENMTKSLANLQLTVPEQRKLPSNLARRPNLGSAGRKVVVFANHFKVECQATHAFHYDVNIVPSAEKRMGGNDDPEKAGAPNRPLPAKLCRALMAELAEQQGWNAQWAFDGKKNLYSPFGPDKYLPKHEHSFEVQLKESSPQRQRNFTVTTKLASQVSISALLQYVLNGGLDIPKDAIQALDVVLRHSASMDPNCTPVGRSLYFWDPSKRQPLGGGAEAWVGYHQSLRPCQFGLVLNVDSAATGFIEPDNLVEFIRKVLGMQPNRIGHLQPREYRKLKKALLGIRVKKEHRHGKHCNKERIRGVTETSADRTMFWNAQEKQDVSVASYFAKAYRKLDYPNLPCIDVGNDKRQILLPAEVCTIIPGQRRKKLDEGQTASMIKMAAQNPASRKQHIEYSVANHARLVNDPCAKAFRMKINPKMLELQARVLPQPRLQYGYPQCMNVGTQGSWNLKDTKFLAGVQIASWAMVNLVGREVVNQEGPTGLKGFMGDLIDMLKKSGLSVVGWPALVTADKQQGIERNMREAHNMASGQFKVPPQLILVLLPTTGAEDYKEVKRISDSVLGVPSQCLVKTKAGIGGYGPPRGRPQYCANLAMKINQKLGGVNCKIVGGPNVGLPIIGQKPFIIFGADVTHPTSFNESEPSVAAVVASMDRYVSHFASRVRVQKHRQEVIADLKGIVKELMIQFYQTTGQKKPERIVFYRDGVSEGQFQEVLNYEYEQIREACGELGDNGADYCPPITFVIVQKRHHTRLFPVDDNKDRSGNVLPGTVIDMGITSSFEFDFFLNSHAGIQGTSRPAHYHVLVDENKLGADAMQLMTYWLCYLYCRCTRSVSYCPPAYYAHLAAFRGKMMVSHSDSESETVSSSHRSAEPRSAMSAIHPNLNGTMFYV